MYHTAAISLKKAAKYAVVLFVCLLGALRAQNAPIWERAYTFGGLGNDAATSVRTDKFGNRYVTGYFSSTAKFGAISRVSSGGTDVFLAKFGSDGNLRWIVRAGGPADDEGSDVAIDPSGNIYLTGWFTGTTASFNSVVGAGRTVSGGVTENIFLAKYLPTGALAWVRTGVAQATSGLNRGHGVAVDAASGRVYVTGVAQAPTVFSSSDGIAHTVPGPGSWHMFLVKYDPAGKFQWGQWNEAAPNSVPSAIAAAQYGVYVTGFFEGTTTFSSQDGANQSVVGFSGPVQSFPDYPGDAFIVKYDSQGSLRWINHVGGYKAFGADISVRNDGKTISVTGTVGNINYGSLQQAQTIVTSRPGGQSISLGGGQFTNPYNPDVFVATYDSAGVLKGAHRIGGTQREIGTGISYAEGNVYIAGTFESPLTVDGHLLEGNPFFPNLFVLKYTAAGLDWAKTAEWISSTERSPRLGVTPAGRVVVAGGYPGTAVFDSFTLTNSGGASDIFLAYSQAAVELSANRINFGSQSVGTTSIQRTVELTNTEARPLTIFNVGVTGDFVVETNTCGTSVAAGATCTITITFSPAFLGSRSGILTVTDNAIGGKRTVNLSGTGI